MKRESGQMEDVVDQIRTNARRAIELFAPISEIDFGFNRDSVAWVEGYIERMRPRANFNDGSWNGLIDSIGSFLGECILARTGGSWQFSDDQRWSISFASGGCAFPMTKVAKQFENGLDGGDSIVGFYDVCVEFVSKSRA